MISWSALLIPLSEKLPKFLMVFSTSGLTMPSKSLINILDMASSAWIIDSDEAVDNLNAQPPFAPSQTIPVKVPTIFLIAPPICSLVPPRAQAIDADAPIPAATAQPHTGDKPPVNTFI